MTRFAIEKKIVTVMALLVIVVAGFMTYLKMPRAEDPGFTIRTAQVTTIFPGASPERVELLVTDKLEKEIQQIPELDYINSESKTGISIIDVNIKESYKEMRPIWDDLRRKVDRVKPDLPDDIIGPIVNDEFGDVFGVVLALTGEGYTYAELKEIADDVRSELLFLEDVAKVDIHGIQEERVFVEYNNARLAELGLSPIQLQQILESRNIIIPGGEIFTADEQIVLEPSGNFDSVEDLRRTVIKLPGRSDLLFLDDLAEIYRGYIDPPTSRVRFRGTPALAIAINLREGGNVIRLGEQVKAQIELFKSSYPTGVEFDPVYFQPMWVGKKIDDFVGSLGQAIGIVLAVMMLFLGLRTGLIISSLIPMAMITAIFVMSFFDIGLDQMSLASLIIALGMLVHVRIDHGADGRRKKARRSRHRLGKRAAYPPAYLISYHCGCILTHISRGSSGRRVHRFHLHGGYHYSSLLLDPRPHHDTAFLCNFSQSEGKSGKWEFRLAVLPHLPGISPVSFAAPPRHGCGHDRPLHHFHVRLQVHTETVLPPGRQDHILPGAETADRHTSGKNRGSRKRDRRVYEEGT
jgi:hypothetical protein